MIHLIKKQIIPTLAICFAFGSYLFAQELPAVQQRSVFAPQNVKIDGKIEDWGAKFQAYNKETRIYYTMANDEKFLYLVIQSVLPAATNKIMRGGISITFWDKEKSISKSSSSLVYPLVSKADRFALNQQIRGATGTTSGDALSFEQSMSLADSVQAASMNKRIAAFKVIAVHGLNGVSDSLISIYNEYSIKTVITYSDRKLNYELAIPLALVDGFKSESGFNYTITLNGEARTPILTTISDDEAGSSSSSGEPIIVVNGVGRISEGQMTTRMTDVRDMITPTYFSAKYVLANKP